MNTTPTPTTDASSYWFTDEDGVRCEAVHADIARKLEAEAAQQVVERGKMRIKMMDAQAEQYALEEERSDMRMEIARLMDEVERLEANAIHSCSPYCQRPACIARRERDEARAELAINIKPLFDIPEQFPIAR